MLDFLPLAIVTVLVLSYAFFRASQDTSPRDEGEPPISNDSGGESF